MRQKGVSVEVEKGLTLGQIAEVFGVSKQRAHKLIKSREWQPLQEGHSGPGAGTTYRREDIVAELQQQIKAKQENAASLEQSLNILLRLAPAEENTTAGSR